MVRQKDSRSSKMMLPCNFWSKTTFLFYYKEKKFGLKLIHDLLNLWIICETQRWTKGDTSYSTTLVNFAWKIWHDFLIHIQMNCTSFFKNNLLQPIQSSWLRHMHFIIEVAPQKIVNKQRDLVSYLFSQCLHSYIWHSLESATWLGQWLSLKYGRLFHRQR